MAEILDVVDEKDRVIGEAPREGIHDTGLRHRAVHIFIFSPDGRLWLERRAAHVDTFPSHISSSVAGHLVKGESYEDAARRELEEELGFTDVALKALHKLPASAETSNEFIKFFVGKTAKKPRIHRDTAELLLMSPGEIRSRMRTGEKMSPDFLKLLDWYANNADCRKMKA